jgi:Alpha/beta hydrolase domain
MSFIRIWKTIAVFVLTALMLPAALAQVPNPVVTGPITVNVPPGDPSHDYPQLATTVDLAAHGYIEEEYFFSGTANTYSTPPLATGVVTSSGRPYKSRMIVRRPLSAGQFNGTVVVEWVNVTSGYNLDALWQGSAEHFMRNGYAYVGVSAQRVGVHQAGTGLKSWSPVRYGSLDVTAGGAVVNDGLQYDIFSQAGQAVRFPSGVNPMGGLPVQRIIAAGVSQSQGRLVTYHNAIQPLAQLYDAYYLFLGIGGRLRSDLPVKVFKIDTETDLLLLGEVAARQDDSDKLRTWEIAGASHVGFTGFVTRIPLLQRDGLPVPDVSVCARPALSHVPVRPVLDVVYDHLVRWTVDGIAPPTAPRVQMVSTTPPVAARDSFGNSLGGIQLSEHAVPLSTDDGLNSGPGFCFLYGSHTDFDEATLDLLYRNHGAYVSRVSQVNDANVAAGYILPEAAQASTDTAAHSDIGKKQKK